MTLHPWKAPYRIESERLSLRALGPQHVEEVHGVIPRNKAHDGILRDGGLSGSGELEDKMVWSLLAREYPQHRLFTAPRPTLFDERYRSMGRGPTP